MSISPSRNQTSGSSERVFSKMAFRGLKIWMTRMCCENGWYSGIIGHCWNWIGKKNMMWSSTLDEPLSFLDTTICCKQIKGCKRLLVKVYSINVSFEITYQSQNSLGLLFESTGVLILRSISSLTLAKRLNMTLPACIIRFTPSSAEVAVRATKAGCKACIGSKCAIRFLASFWTHQMDANVDEFLEVMEKMSKWSLLEWWIWKRKPWGSINLS